MTIQPLLMIERGKEEGRREGKREERVEGFEG